MQILHFNWLGYWRTIARNWAGFLSFYSQKSIPSTYFHNHNCKYFISTIYHLLYVICVYL